MYYFKDIIDEIEKNITGEISIGELARKSNMSIYEFRRIFSFVAKIPFGEYVRKRRLSLAAVELYEKNHSITEVAAKYGYDSASSFARAFREFHGITPTDVVRNNSEFRLLTKISAEIVTTGGSDISYSISEEPAFCVRGIMCESQLSDTECCEDAWERFYADEHYPEIERKSDRIYAVYENGEGTVNCCIGIKSGTVELPDKVHIPSSLWVSFKMTAVDDDTVNRFYNNILNQWFSSVGYERNCNIPVIEVFPSDMSEDGFEWEIRIPIKRQ